MTPILRKIVDLFNALAAWYYRRKLGAAARQLGRLPEARETGRGARATQPERGFIIVEIDGLAHAYLKEGVRAGTMPYLGRLIQRREVRLSRWRCGLPSTTPASQAGILYGNNWDIPGFRWYEKDEERPIECKMPGTVRAIQERVSAGRAGLLRGGSSYANMFDGDARLALFTLAAFGRDRLFENVRGLGFLVLFALSPGRILKVAALSLWTWIVYVAKRALSMIVPSKPVFTFWGPVGQIFYNVVFREVTTFCTMVDIYRGMPAIYAAYAGYDDIAHHFGVDSTEAFRALHGIDKQIRQIDRIRRRYRQRDYDLYILSDHGMTPSEPFRRAFGQTLQAFIASHTGQSVTGGEPGRETEGLHESGLRFLLDEIHGLEARPHRTLAAQLFRLARELLESRLAGWEPEEWDLSRREEIVVRCSGSLAHVYFNVVARPMDLSEVTALYSSLLEALLEHPGIGLAIGREGEQVVLTGRQGTRWIGAERDRLEGTDPLHNMAQANWAAEQIARVARFPHAGDLILLGAWDGESVISFEDQVASHGGLGGPQAWPFIAYSAQERLSPREIENSEELYAHLNRTYGGYS